ncbi:hypothetical protein [Lysinibacillus fusiformis]|uniref:hypothetical protein n=1 Tax=Lysinibacillus fusiformis TaxID=28031 RepID=UPI0011A91A25|nr:hypothetical protein [Lysinibacillus fusiformis]
MEEKELFTLFDDLIYSPKLEKEYVKAGFPNGSFRGIYALFNSEYKALSTDCKSVFSFEGRL